MTGTTDTTGNPGYLAGNRGMGPQADLAGISVRVGGEKGLETTDKGGTSPSIWSRIGDLARRAIGDPVELVGTGEGVPLPPLEQFDWAVVLDVSGDNLSPTIAFDYNLGQPIELLINGQRYVHEERVAEAFEDLSRAKTELVAARAEVEGLRGDVRSAEAGADEWKSRAINAQKDLLAANAKIADLSQPRIINVAGLVDADLAERYESLRQSFETVSIQLATAQALIAESAPVVRFVQMLANLEGDEMAANLSIELRDAARGTFVGAGAYNPRTYTDEQRGQAAERIWTRLKMVERGDPMVYEDALIGVDAVAVALGMRRAGA